jgi:hypothetical protein
VELHLVTRDRVGERRNLPPVRLDHFPGLVRIERQDGVANEGAIVTSSAVVGAPKEGSGRQ